MKRSIGGLTNTQTGSVLERMVLPALDHGEYVYKKQQIIGKRFGALGRHKADLVVTDPSGQDFLVSLKWQQASGTAEEKVPFEILCLADAIRTSEGKYNRAYVVLGGAGWKLKQFYIQGGLNTYLQGVEAVTVLDLDEFVGRANRRRL